MFRIWRREGSGSSGSSRKEDEGEQGEEWGMMEEIMREGVEEEQMSGEINASLGMSSPVKGEDPFSASEDEIRAIEDWWSQKEEAEEEVEEDESEEEVMGEEEKEEDSSADELLSRLKEIGTEEEEEESPLMHEMEEMGGLSVEDLLLLAKETLENIEEIRERRGISADGVKERASEGAAMEVEKKRKISSEQGSSFRVFS